MARPKHKRQTPPSPWPLVMIVGGLALLGAAAFALLGGNAATAPIEVNGAPRLKVDRAKVDLGNVQLGEWVAVKFSLTNVGDQPLRFSEAPYVELAAGC